MAVSNKPVVRVLGLYALLGGLLSFIGWVADIQGWTDWAGIGISIQPNATVAVMLSGLSLLLLSFGLRRAAGALGGVVGLIGASTLFQIISGATFESLNTLLMFGREWGRVGVTAPGRMGPPGSLCWTLIGMALITLAAPPGSRPRRFPPRIALLTLGIATLSIAGYVYGADPLYSLPNSTVIALQTASFIAAVSLAVIASAQERPPTRWLLDRGVLGTVAQRAMPLIIVVPLVVGWLCLLGETRGWYDARFGAAIFVVATIALLFAVMYWSLSTISRHERALRESERKVKDTLESITDGFVTFDRDWRYTFVNEEAARLMQRDRSEMLGRTAWELFPESVNGKAYIELHRAAEMRNSVEYEDLDPVLQRWFASKVYPTQDGGLAVYFQDVTERKQFKEQMDADIAAIRRLQALSTQLVRSGELTPLLQEILVTAIDLSGADKGDIQFYDADADTLRIVVHRGLRSGFLEHFASDGCDATCGEAARTFQRVVVDDVEMVDALRGTPHLDVLRAEGIRAMQCTPLVSRDGRMLGMLNTHFKSPGRPEERALRFLDVLARQAADLIERKQAEDAMHEADRRKDEFLATLAHELRNPLAPVRNSLELMKRAEDDTQLTAQARSTMERQIGHMVRLIDDLLDVGRISRNRLELSREPVELASVVYHAIEASRPLYETVGHELSVDLPDEPVYLHADPMRLAQVLTNLLTNAGKYTKPGGRIQLQATRQGSEVAIKVKDNGVGIPPDMLPKVFEMFTQVDRSLERSEGGLGIGLALVKRLVELHNGTVAARSEGKGRGSEFVVKLPVLEAVASVKRDEKTIAAATAPAIPRRILVVDDNTDSAHSLAMLLKYTGNNTEIAHDGVAAVELAAAYRPDVILLDIGLPRMNGYDTCRAIRAEAWGKDIVIIALTGWGQADDRRKSTEAGFDGHLVKPVDHDALMSMLGSLLKEA